MKAEDMDHWNYRVIRSVDELGDDLFSIHEVYYTKDGTVLFWAPDAAEPFGETVEEVSDDLGYMKQALGRPVLDYDDMPQGEE